MKRTTYITIKFFCVSLILLAAVICSSNPATAAANRVAVLPFKINAEKDLTFIRDGIVDMLTSRLAWEDKVIVINREETAKALEGVTQPITGTKAREIGKGLAVDYVLFGSLTVFGNSVSIDAKMIDVSGNKQPLALFNQGQGMDEVIPAINQFATDINDKIFGRAMTSHKADVRPQTTQEQPDLRMHPEKLFAAGFGAVDEEGTRGTSPGSAFIADAGTTKASTQFWKSPSIKERITGLAVGDVDKDGQQETVIITEHTVELYRYEKKRFHKVKTLVDRGLDNLIGVDVADINANGYPEIIVSSVGPNRRRVNSFVLEFNGTTFAEIVKNDLWYYRVFKHPGRGNILLGQKEVVKGPFGGTIYEMVWMNSRYEPSNSLNLPNGHANVLGLAVGNIMNDGQEVTAAFDKEDYLRLYDATGSQIWKSGEHSGGGTEYFVISIGSAVDEQVRGYYPIRTIIQDINHDGKNEVITANNQRLSELLSYRKFTHGEIEIRVWDGVGLAARWRTRKLSGYFSDVAIGDFDNDGHDELIAALVIDTGAIVTTTPKSVVIAYELE